MTEITRGVRKQLDFHVGVGKPRSGNSNVYMDRLTMHMQSYEASSYLFEYDQSLMNCKNVTYGCRGLLKPLAIYFSKTVTDETKDEIYSLLENEKTMDEPQLQPDLTALAFTFSVMCKVNIHLELGAPDLMYVYN